MEKQEREPVWVPIHKLLGKVPGGRIIIPLIIGSIIVTICDACGVKDPWGQVGSPSLYLFSSKGITIVLGFMLFFTGTQIDVRKMKSMLGRGFPLLVLRLGIAYGLSFLFFFLTKDYDYMWIGISFVTFTSCLTSTNAGMFMGLVNPYGDDADYSYFGLLLLTALPAFPMLLIQGSTSGGIDYMSMISILLPILFGMLLGNLDPSIRKVFKHGNDVVIPFLGFQFGSAIKLGTAVQMIPQGLFLIACWYILGVLPSMLMERYVLKRPGYISMGCSAMAGVALSIPELVYERNIFPNFDSVALDNSLASLALVLVVTSILCPILTENNNKYYYKHHKEVCENKFPSLSDYVEKMLDRDMMNSEMKRIKKAKKYLAMSDYSLLSKEQKKEYKNNLKKERVESRKKTKELLLSMPKKQRSIFVRQRKLDKEDEQLFEEEVYAFMAKKKNQCLTMTRLLEGEALIEAYEKNPLLDSERKNLVKRLKKENSQLTLISYSKRELAIRAVESYDIAKTEYIEK